MALLFALLCQLLAGMLIILAHAWLLDWQLNDWIWVVSQAFLAAGYSFLIKQPSWWQGIHLLFLPAIVATLAFNLPAWWYLVIFIILTLIFWGTVTGDVPLFLSSNQVAEEMLAIIKREHASSFVDLGAGIGTLLIPLAKQLPDLKITGLEKAPLPWLLAVWRCRHYPNVKIHLTSLWKNNLAEYDLVFAFLSPAVMDKVGQKLRQEIQPGRLFVSAAFSVPNWLPEAEITLADRQKTCLFCYRQVERNTPFVEQSTTNTHMSR